MAFFEWVSEVNFPECFAAAMLTERKAGLIGKEIGHREGSWTNLVAGRISEQSGGQK